MSDRRERLLERTARLVDVPSVSRDESAILDLLATEIATPAVSSGALEVLRADGVVAYLPTRRTDAPLLLLAGHVDTVPPQANHSADLVGDLLAGVGTTDMKGAIAVIWDLLEAAPASALDVGAVFFGREEIAITESALLPFLRAEEARLGDTALAVVMEPTDNELHLGCVGNLNASVTYRGEAAHSARPWLGSNAIHAAVRGLAGVAAHEERIVDVGGLEFREVANVTMFEGGVAQNVIPDVVQAHVNLRYAPGRESASAQAELIDLCGPGATVEIISDAPSGPIPVNNELADRLHAVVDGVAPKQAWTPVAEFGLVGIDAVNLGPGDPSLAHRPDEAITGAALERCAGLLTAFLEDA